MAIEFAVQRIGDRAIRVLQQHGEWRVEAVFERSLYLRSGPEFICIGDASICDGPLNAILVRGQLAGTVGEAARVHLSADTVIWTAPQWPLVPPPEQRAATIARLQQATSPMVPSDCIGASALSKLPSVAPLHERASAGLLALRRGDYDHAADRLLGLGVGLTPGGDDVLAGTLIALKALGCTTAASYLARAVLLRAISATSPLSAAFLRAAADGEASAQVYNALSCLITGAPPDQVIAALANIGHTSGWEMLAGMVLAFKTAA